jgi:UDP-glucuronate decarboxylase
MKNSKILITGAAGFLGFHLTEMFLKTGYSVIALDDFSTGSEKNVHNFLNNENYEFIEHDIREYRNFSMKFDYILNFACPASPQHYQSDPVKTIETNFLGISNMLKLAREQRIPILQASTSEVYGDPKESPQVEEYWGNVNTIGIRSCYDEGKRAAETLCFDYKRQFGLDVKIIRIFNTYGPKMSKNDGRVVSNFIVQALLDRPITIYGDGSQTRSFCYVSDLVEGINKFMTVQNQIATPINLGNPKECSVKDLAEQIINLTKSKSKIIYLDLPSDDPKQRRPDINKAKNYLGWEPKISLTDGLVRTIEFFKGELLDD